MIYCLTQFMKEEGFGYRRISKKLNQWVVKIHIYIQWFNASLSPILIYN